MSQGKHMYQLRFENRGLCGVLGSDFASIEQAKAFAETRERGIDWAGPIGSTSDGASYTICEVKPAAPAEGRPEPILKFFKYDHLPEHLQGVSKPFGELAAALMATLPQNAERSVALRKLLEAKDAAVRATLP